MLNVCREYCSGNVLCVLTWPAYTIVCGPFGFPSRKNHCGKKEKKKTLAFAIDKITILAVEPLPKFSGNTGARNIGNSKYL